MTLEQIQSKKQKNLDTIGEEFGKKVEESQDEIFPLIIALLALIVLIVLLALLAVIVLIALLALIALM